MAIKEAFATLVPKYEQAEPMVPSRRRFAMALLGTGLAASLVSFLYPIVKYVIPPPTTDMGGDTVSAGKIAELKPNSAKVFRFGSKPGLLIRDPEGQYRAISATCTHLSCTVQYRSDVRQVWCACHNGYYDMTGRNLSGPPPRPLEAFDVHVQGEDIVVSRKRGA